MKKNTKIIIIFLAALIIAAATVTGLIIGWKKAEAKKAVNRTVTIEISEKAAEKRDQMLAADLQAGFREENFEETRQNIYDAPPQTFPEVQTKNQLNREMSGGSEVYTLSSGSYDSIVLYIHGGAWVYGIEPVHVSFCDGLVDRLHAKVYMPLYPLAPQACYPVTYEMVMGLYQELLSQGKPIYVMGDSAGGTISMGLVQRLKKAGKKLPDKLVVLNGCMDLTLSDPQLAEIEKNDPLLAVYGCRECARYWSGGTDLADPALSAVNSDLKGYPDTMIFVATNDILGPDGVKTYELMKAAGNNVSLVTGEGLWHVFSVFDIPEKEQSLQLIQEFCGK